MEGWRDFIRENFNPAMVSAPEFLADGPCFRACSAHGRARLHDTTHRFSFSGLPTLSGLKGQGFNFVQLQDQYINPLFAHPLESLTHQKPASFRRPFAGRISIWFFM